MPEPVFAVHGDVLYRFALALVGNERQAARLLRVLAAVLPAGSSSEPELLASLLAVAHREAERAPRRWRRPQLAPPFGPFVLTGLPLIQRAALVAHLLLGYDSQQLADLLGLAPDAARAALIDAVRALGPSAGLVLTDRVSDEHCVPVRDLLVDPAPNSRQSATVRGHLATCSHCRAFDHAWIGITQAVEAALRNTLRDQRLPAPLAATLLTSGRAGAAWSWPRLALVPLIVMALIAALVLPGFLRQPVQVVDRTQSAPIDPLALLDRAIARQAAPPERSGVWYARYETLWYFADNLYAPLLAELWLDPREPARHRLQLSHREGGAPYELQLGDGVRRLSYALDAAYAPAIYGALPIPAKPGSPALIDQPLATAGQLRARAERLASGPWSLAPTYLRQARAASDLRLLGRQRDGRHVVQILSFSAPSPLGWPADSPSADHVTVLLAIDVEAGLLRRVTELVGPPDGTQISRVTWNLVAEDWLVSNEQIREAFTVQRAWTGVGDFNELVPVPSADLALPLVAERSLADPARLFDLPELPLWFPARPPPEVDRALLIWPNAALGTLNLPEGLVYLGAGRRLIMTIGYTSPPPDNQPEVIGVWQVTLAPGYLGRYTVVLARDPGGQSGALEQEPGLPIRIDAWGFTRAELLKVIAALDPLTDEALAAHADLFILPLTGTDSVRP